MFVFREAQMKAFEDSALDDYIKELIPHFMQFSPELCLDLTYQELHPLLLQCINRAEAFGFTQRGPTESFIEMMILFGSGFDSDPQYPWAAEILADKDENNQMERAETLYDRSMEYEAVVDDMDNYQICKALKDSIRRWPHGAPFKPLIFEEHMLRVISEIHPAKTKEVGDSALRQLIYGQRQKGEHYGFKETRSLALLVILSFSFGHDFDNDPFYPWISQILDSTKQGNPDRTAEKLERKTIEWVETAASNKAAARKQQLIDDDKN